ncbi:hypothetical protein CTAYLR_000959 [Chrysophaeum taylorii]|uniref:Peroxiredoxin-like 2A n=1 Tax=Chrysophaeum taylorii TaxID=2483200 RepID=A0AAD7UFY7_9STRA|nr:hypothetical protein CTAYLR_000959 [Chrysophaeum taylorii]
MAASPPYDAKLVELGEAKRELASHELWASSPRCVLKKRVYARKAELDALGVALCCTVKEDLDDEIKEFRQGFWPEAPIYLDAGMAWYKAVQGGGLTKSTLAGFLAKLLNPFSRLSANLKRSKAVEGNMKGEGFIHGGVFVIRKGAKRNEAAVFSHAEKELGDGPPTDSIIDAAKKA